jgi:tRNA(Ile)-lysidine synthase
MRLRRLEPLLRRALRGPCALPRGSRLLVAVSGGADSTALLIGLSRVAPEQGLTLQAAHLHHGLRGAEADQDLEFVHRLCAGLGVPLSSARWNTRLRMRRRRLSGESGLRTLRREFLLHAAKRVGAVAVATAHTADDQLETVLMRLLRGTGLLGLGGMSPRRGGWIKPMLEATRADVEADLRGAGGSPGRHARHAKPSGLWPPG